MTDEHNIGENKEHDSINFSKDEIDYNNEYADYMNASLPEEDEYGNSIFESLDLSNDNVIADPTDFSDIVQKRNRNKIIMICTVVAACVLAPTVMFAYTYLAVQGPNDETTQPQPTVTGTTQPNTPQKDAELNTPLLKAFPNAPKVQPATIVVGDTTNPNGSPTGGNTLYLNNPVLSKPANQNTTLNSLYINDWLVNQQQCTVVETTDFCSPAIGIYSKNKIKFTVYFLPDAVHSRMFENPASFQKVTIPGSPVSAIINLTIQNKNQPVLVITNKNSSGWMILLDNQEQIDSATTATKVLHQMAQETELNTHNSIEITQR